MSSLLEALRGVPNGSEPLPGLLTSGQPGPQQLEALKRSGVETILDIRDPMEPRGFDEPGEASRLGLRYVNISVRQGMLDDAMLEAVLAELRSGNRPMLFHCASANRVGGALIPYLILDHGMGEDEAVETAMRVGLRGPDLLEWGLDYARRKTGG